MEYDVMKMMTKSTHSSIIKVIGVGSFGVGALDYMYSRGIKGVDFFVCNTDKKSLNHSSVPNKIEIGLEKFGAGGDPGQGEKAVIESYDKIDKVFDQHAKMAFIAAGMGGGTGTGAAPKIAEMAKEKGLLTIAVVTLPSLDEGPALLNVAIKGVREIAKSADSVLIINKQKIFEIFDKKIAFRVAREKLYDVLNTAVKGIAEVITVHGYINLDFADVRTVTQKSGVAVMGAATAEGEGRALNAIKQALVSPLLMSSNVRCAKQILLNVYFSSKPDEAIRLSELDEIANYVDDAVGEDANIILGVNYNDELKNQVAVTIVATGFELEDVLDQKYFVQKVRPSFEKEKESLEGKDDLPVYNGQKVWLRVGMKEEDIAYYKQHPAHKRSGIRMSGSSGIREEVTEYKLETNE